MAECVWYTTDMGWLNYVPPAIADERTPNMYLCTFGGHKLYFSLCVLDRLPGFLPFQHLDSLLSNNHNNIYIYMRKCNTMSINMCMHLTADQYMVGTMCGCVG